MFRACFETTTAAAAATKIRTRLGDEAEGGRCLTYCGEMELSPF